jgi:hypothetical protein
MKTKMTLVYPKMKDATELRLIIGEIKTSEAKGTYWSPDDKVKNLLEYRPSIEDMKLILEPMCYLFIEMQLTLLRKSLNEMSIFILQKQRFKWFLREI